MIDLKHYSPTKARWLTKMSNIPRRFLGMELSDITGFPTPPQITDWLDMALNGEIIKQTGHLGITGKGLLFDGGPGIGKTTHAVITAMSFIYGLPDDEAAMRDILKIEGDIVRSRPVYYLTYPEFLTKKKATFDAHGEEKEILVQQIEGFHGRSKHDHLNVRVLVLDDLGKEYGSVYDNASFDEILRARYDQALPTIVTTNVMLENWQSVYKSAMASFANEAFDRVPIIGADRRGAE